MTLNIILHIAVLTLLLQGFLFPLLVLMSLHWLWHARSTKGDSDVKRRAESVEEKKQGGRVLQPLKCPSCGGGVPLREAEMACASCGAPVAAPPHYADIGRLRGEALARLRHAAKYLRRARFFSSNYVRWALFLIALWLFVVPFLMITVGTEFSYYDKFLASLGLWFSISFGSLILWILILCFTAGMMSEVRQVLPTIEGGEKVGEAEAAVCSMCGGAVAYEKGDLATVCGYCGVETYRVTVAWQARTSAKQSREVATVSLVEAMQAAREAVDDLVSTPAILIFIFIICPFFMIYVPYLAYTYITEHLLISIPVILCLIACGYLLKRFYWKKA